MPESPPSNSTAGESFLALGADTDKSNWTWSKKSNWEPEEGEYQQFYDHWRNRTFPTSQTFPYVLPLGVDNDGDTLLPFHGQDTTGNRILVTKSYDEMFHRILHFRATGERHHGVVITGQPGCGKTTFQKYMLARLLSTDQVVLFSSSSLLYLFFDGKVYLSTTGHFLNLPKHREKYDLWTLVDLDVQSSAPTVPIGPHIWPIQVSPPDPSRYKGWRKQANAALWGMPLWSMEELLAGLPLQPGYDRLRTDLEKVLPFLDENTATLPKPMDAVIEVLRRERRRAENGGEEVAGSSIKNGPTITWTASKDSNSVDDALKTLVHNATSEFGFAPRDVYNAIFDLPPTRTEHDAALVGFGCSEILASIRAFAINHAFPSEMSYRIFTMAPLHRSQSSSASQTNDDWTITFKSLQIAKKVIIALINSDDTHEDLQTTYGLLHRYPRGATLVGCVFEAMIHRMLAGTSFEDRELWQIRMDRTEIPGVYSTNFTTSDAWWLPPPQDGSSGSVAVVDLNGSLDVVTLDRGRNYYIPTPSSGASPNPLFHSFSVDFDFDGPGHIGSGVVISVFGISMSGRHCTTSESSEGLDNHFIRKIVARVRALLESASASEEEGEGEEGEERGASHQRQRREVQAHVRVAYCLVCPQAEDQRVYEFPAWEMPCAGGWDELELDTDTDDSGDSEVFCMFAPDAVR